MKNHLQSKKYHVQMTGIHFENKTYQRLFMTEK